MPFNNMKDIRPKLIELFREGHCTPQIGRVAKAINEPSSTIHYNIKKLEKEGAVKAYKAVFDYREIGEGFCAFVYARAMKVRAKDQDEYFNVLKNLVSKEKGIQKNISIISLKEIKTEFVES